VRVNGAATGRFSEGGFRLERRGEAGRMANLSLAFIPTLDPRPHPALTFAVRGPEGTALLVRAKDGYDEMGIADGVIRLAHRRTVALTGDWRTVTLPLDGFEVVDERRPIPMHPHRIRALVFEIGNPLGREVRLAESIRIDDVKLTGGAGEPKGLADFDRAPSETLFLTEGVASAFARTLFRESQLADFRPDANTYVTPAIFGADYDPSLVHSGIGSFRLTLPREGAAAGVLSFNPDRSYREASAITFRARGGKGGERLRVTFRDALDDEIGNRAPASAPRWEGGGRLLEGRFALTEDWREYRIRRSDLPDVDFRSLLAIRFEFGTEEGNAPGTTIYLDDIRWE